MNKGIRKLCLLSIFISLDIVLSFVQIPVVGSAVRITLTFITSMAVACIFDLESCILYAIAADILSFMVTGGGDTFFLGYTASAVLALTLYWLYLHNGVTIPKITFAKLSVNILVNCLAGSIWRSILYGKTFMYYVGISLVKNIIVLPEEVVIFYLVYNYVIKRLVRIYHSDNFNRKGI